MNTVAPTHCLSLYKRLVPFCQQFFKNSMALSYAWDGSIDCTCCLRNYPVLLEKKPNLMMRCIACRCSVLLLAHSNNTINNKSACLGISWAICRSPINRIHVTHVLSCCNNPSLKGAEFQIRLLLLLLPMSEWSEFESQIDLLNTFKLLKGQTLHVTANVNGSVDICICSWDCLNICMHHHVLSKSKSSCLRQTFHWGGTCVYLASCTKFWNKMDRSGSDTAFSIKHKKLNKALGECSLEPRKLMYW